MKWGDFAPHIGRNRALIAGVAALALVWTVAAKHLAGRIGEVGQEIEQHRRRLEHQKGILAKEGAFMARYEEIRQAEQAGEPDEKLSAIIGDIELWAKEESLGLNDVRPLPREEESGVPVLRLALELEGEMGNLARFLYKMSMRPEPIRLDRFSLYQKVRLQRQINMNVELSLVWTDASGSNP
jgi:hypothetical protein